MNTKFYKTCAVPMCKSNSNTTPEKLFIHLPKNKVIRKKWLTLARRDPEVLATTSTSHFCEDHFDLPNDMENYVEYTTMGVVAKVRMKPDCLPRKFSCQPKRPNNTSSDLYRPAALKRQRLSLIKECGEEYAMRASQKYENISIDVPSSSSTSVQSWVVMRSGVHIPIASQVTTEYHETTNIKKEEEELSDSDPITIVGRNDCESDPEIPKLQQTEKNTLTLCSFNRFVSLLYNMERCINCYIAVHIPLQYPINAINLSPDILSILVDWIGHEVSETDHICRECFNFLTTEVNNRSEGNVGVRHFGHQSVCVGCGRSISRQTGRISRRLRNGSPEFDYIAKIVNLSQIHGVDAQVCNACWQKAHRHVTQQQRDNPVLVPETGSSSTSELPDIESEASVHDNISISLEEVNKVKLHVGSFQDSTSTPKSIEAHNEEYCNINESVFSNPMESEATSTPKSIEAHNEEHCNINESVFSNPMESEAMECETLCYSFLDKCRLCLLNLGVTNIVETKDLLENVFVCTGLRISSSDNLPQKVCAECLETIERATKLRHLAIINDSNLRSLLPPDAEEATPTIADPLDLADVKPIITVDCNVSVTEDELEQETNENKNCKETPSETEQTEMENNLSVRKDLFEKPASPTLTMIVIRTQEDFNKHKYRIKCQMETDCFIYECETCSKVFPGWKQLYLHSKFHQKRMACPLDACGKMFAYKADLEKHIRTHTGVKPFTCQICNKSFSQQGTLKSHIATHADHMDTVH